MAASVRFVCFGSSRCAPDSAAARQAETVGRLLAEASITVSSGGYDGAMGAVSRGARNAGGRVLGVTTPIFRGRTANPHLHEEFVEPDYLSRMATLIRQGHGFVGLPGALGTAAEVLTTWCLLTIGELEGPFFLFEDPWRPLVSAVMALDEAPAALDRPLHWVSDTGEFEVALRRWRRGLGGGSAV